MKQRKAVEHCYDMSAKNYADALFNELDGKPLDRLLLNDFANRMNGLGQVIELGCGCGHIARYLHNKGVSPIIGVDISKGMIVEAKRRNADIDVAYEVGDMMDLKYADDAFIGVVAFYAIVHFTYDELQVVFSEVYRITKSGGNFLFCFHIGEEERRTDDLFNIPVDVTFYFFIVERILEILKECGWDVFEVIERYPYEDKEHPSRRAYITCVKN